MFADLAGGTGFDRYPVNIKQEQEVLPLAIDPGFETLTTQSGCPGGYLRQGANPPAYPTRRISSAQRSRVGRISLAEAEGRLTTARAMPRSR